MDSQSSSNVSKAVAFLYVISVRRSCAAQRNDPLLIRSDEQAFAFAEQLGDARAIVMRANGAVCVGPTVEESVVMAFYLEESAATELAVLATGDEENSACLTAEQVEIRATGSGRIYERMWDYMTAGDPEK